MMRTLWRMARWIMPFRGRIALAILLGVATIVSGIGLMSTSAYIISAAALHPSIAVLDVAIVGVRFFGIARGIFRYLERLVSHSVTFRILARLRVHFYDALEPLAPAGLGGYRTGDLFARMLADVEVLQHFFVRVIAPSAVAVVVTLLTWLFMRAYDLRLANAVAACLVLGGVAVPALAHILAARPGQRLVTVQGELTAQVFDGLHGMPELVAFGRERDYQRQIAILARQAERLRGRLAWINGLHAALTMLLVYVAGLFVLLIAIPLVAAGRLSGVYLAVLFLAATASFEAVAPLPAAFEHLASSVAAARRLFEIADHRPAVSDPPHPSPPPHDFSLALSHLSMRYDLCAPRALDDVSFTIPAGGTLAVVGPSGAGKSTLISVLMRFWDYESGECLLGGHDLRAYRQDDVRACMSVVSQHTYLFSGTIRQNLLIARPSASEADMIAAARQARLHDFVESLPLGYDTWIGEDGARLSGGQRQRIAIARALLADAPILLLDEATANLDTLTERDVLREVLALAQGRTTLIVTHRLIGLDAADEIVVLDAGRVVERGTQDDLLARRGLYRRMWDLQSAVLPDTAPV